MILENTFGDWLKIYDITTAKHNGCKTVTMIKREIERDSECLHNWDEPKPINKFTCTKCGCTKSKVRKEMI